MTQLVPECVTQMEYYLSGDSSFCVLSNQRTILGVSKTDKKTIIRHSISDFSGMTVTYTANTAGVFTLSINEPQNMLLAGGISCNLVGEVVLYGLSTGQVIKTFGKVNYAPVQSSFKVDNLWFIGFFGSFKFAVIDSVSRQVLGKSVKFGILNIFSMAVCKKLEKHNDSQVLLFTVGDYFRFSENDTDVFDITALVNRHSILSNKQVSFES